MNKVRIAPTKGTDRKSRRLLLAELKRKYRRCYGRKMRCEFEEVMNKLILEFNGNLDKIEQALVNRQGKEVAE